MSAADPDRSGRSADGGAAPLAPSPASDVLHPVSAKAVVLRGGAVLLARNDRAEWELPGGRVEAGEGPEDAVVREVAEETGLVVAVTADLGQRPFEVVPGRVVLIAGYACAITEDRALVRSAEHDAVAWQPLDGLDRLALPQVYRDLVAQALGEPD